MNDIYERLTGQYPLRLGDRQDAAAEIARLRAENEALRKDAERYRYIRYGLLNDIEPDDCGDPYADGVLMSEKVEIFDRMSDSIVAKVAIATENKSE